MTRKHIPELDGVRGLACLLVIVLHVVVAPLPLFPGTWFDLARFRIQPFMSGGVDLFFILSGFLISGALMDSKGSPGYFRAFWTRRIARIFPVYYLMIIFSIVARAAYDVSPAPVLHALVNLSLPEGYYAIFSQNIVMALTKASGNNILGVTWSLAIEEQFYLVFPFLVFLVPRRWLVVSAVAVVVSTPLIRALVVANVNWQAGYLLTVARMDALMLGVLLAALVRHAPALAIARRVQGPLNWLALALIIMQLCDFWGYVGEQWRLSLGGNITYLMLIVAQYPLINIAMACLMLNIFTREAGPLRPIFTSRILTSIGLISYGAYMYHQVVNYALWRWLYASNPREMTLHQAYMPVTVLLITAAISWVSLRYFEMPIRRWITRQSRRDAASAGALTAKRA
ncbi:acyltransferase [Bosea sp. BK604]|uniref:acyltransferase family protein n=1 Tax=Bosea sp. BK604 TaxID=2512180 RepID=UPI001044F78B|nr:acyltransferase [Bosea sp. BK604]TCR61199.1 peptidoglycan/LPS O-acetylase OafA/YrhL [Bosea sp. BK604]